MEDELPAHKRTWQNKSGYFVGGKRTPQRKVVKGRREAADDGATARSEKAFQLGNVEQWKPLG